MTDIRTVEYDLPSHWASALIPDFGLPRGNVSTFVFQIIEE